MIIKCIAVGNSTEAFVEKRLSSHFNIIFSDDNNKGKTIIIQSMMYTIGNKPIFPSSFPYKDYYYYIEFEQNGKEYLLSRMGDSYILKSSVGLYVFDGVSEFKQYWTSNLFCLPVIPFNCKLQVSDFELFSQLFFVPQDGKDTSTIFNQGYYHKEDLKNLLLSYAKSYASDVSRETCENIKQEIRNLKTKREEEIRLCEFYRSESEAVGYLSTIKDQEFFKKRVEDIDVVTGKMAEVKKRRTRFATQKSLWKKSLNELESINRNMEVGELRCMDCNSTHIAYKGSGRAQYSFDVSTKEMRAQIRESIQRKIQAYSEEIDKCDYEIAQFQTELTALMDEEDITAVNVLLYKSGFQGAEETEKKLHEIDERISQLETEFNAGVAATDEAKQKRQEFLRLFVDRMNEIRKLIDPDSNSEYSDIFTKRGTVISGSEETIFFVARLITAAEKVKHDCPIVMDSFRAEDLSTEKEEIVLQLMRELTNQVILTTTIKKEETGKYENVEGVTAIDYSDVPSSKLLSPTYVDEFRGLMAGLMLQI